jgi:hypothetical protein
MNLTNRLELIGSDRSSQPSPPLPCSSLFVALFFSRSQLLQAEQELRRLPAQGAPAALPPQGLPRGPRPPAAAAPPPRGFPATAAGVALPLVPDNLGGVRSAGSRAPDDLAGRQLWPPAAGGSASPCDERRRERWTEERSTGEEERAGWMIRSNRLGQGKWGVQVLWKMKTKKKIAKSKKEEILLS